MLKFASYFLFPILLEQSSASPWDARDDLAMTGTGLADVDTSVTSSTPVPASTGLIFEYNSGGGYVANYTAYANFDGTKFAKTNYYELDDYVQPHDSVGPADQFIYSPSDGTFRLWKAANQSQSQLEGDYLWYDPEHGSLNYGGKGHEYKNMSLVVGADTHDAAAGKLARVSCSLSKAGEFLCPWGKSKVTADMWLCKGSWALVAPGYDANNDCHGDGITFNLTSVTFQTLKN